MNFDNYLNQWYTQRCACNPIPCEWDKKEEYDPFVYEDEAKTILVGVQEGVILEGEVVIPDRVVKIGDQAFSRCTGLTSITIPDSVTSIGLEAFNGCARLSSVTIGNGVTSIGKYAFRNCTGLKSITWNAKKCGKWEQYDYVPFYTICANITSFTFGNEVKSIPDYLCYSMSKLTSITIPENVTSIGNYAFRNCSGLTSITIPNSVTSIGEKAFSYSRLTSIIVESGNTVYDSRENCNAIIKTATNALLHGCNTTVIPNSVTSVKKDAFSKCTFTKANFINNSSATGYPWGATITE